MAAYAIDHPSTSVPTSSQTRIPLLRVETLLMSFGASHALDSSVLVLNKFYMAVHVISAKRAFCLLCKELAEVVTIDDGRYSSFDFQSWREVSETRATFKSPDDDFIRTVQFAIQIPRVIRLLAYDRLPRQKVKFNRRNIFARDGNRCQYCGKRFPTSELSLDHVLPRSRGGLANWINIVCACLRCNVKKGGRTPWEAKMKLVKEPEQPRMSPILALKLTHRRYKSWKSFLDNAYWSVELK